MQINGVRGPLFIVGRPRSGTKLLRQLLNEHPEVNIPLYETHFIVPAIRRFGLQPRLHDDKRFDIFFAGVARSNFYKNMQAEGLVLSAEYLRQIADLDSWPSIFEVILKFYGPKGSDHTGIWGDKTPSYLPDIGLLDRVFPGAHFLHILRDPRDCCLSMQKVWGRDLWITADIWQNEVRQARQSGQQIGPRYTEVRFEALLSNPEETLQTGCDFLGIDYLPSMTHLSAPAENLGDATGYSRIVSTNQQKYLSQLAPEQIKRIEEIVYTTAVDLGYELHYAQYPRPLQPGEAVVRKLQDRIAWAKFHLQGKGLRHGLAYLYRSL